MLRILCLGDSYTVGEGVSRHASWPSQLIATLRRKRLPAEVKIVAQTGWTSAELLVAMRERFTADSFDVVLLMIGVNNQYQGLPLDEHAEIFQALLEQAVRLLRQRDTLFVVSIPDWTVSPFARTTERDLPADSGEIDRFNQVNKRIAQDFDASWIDVTLVSRSAVGDDMFAADGLHPSAEQYQKWMAVIAPAVVRAASV